MAIIDELLARQLFGDEDPIGQIIRAPQQPGEPDPSRGHSMQVVGVAPPIRQELLQRRAVSHLYVPFGRDFRATMHLHVKIAPGYGDGARLDRLREEIRAVEPRLPVLALSTMESFHSRSLELWAITTGGRMFTVLGLIAMLLAVVGVYGVKSYLRCTADAGNRHPHGARRH